MVLNTVWKTNQKPCLEEQTNNLTPFMYAIKRYSIMQIASKSTIYKHQVQTVNANMLLFLTNFTRETAHEYIQQ